MSPGEIVATLERMASRGMMGRGDDGRACLFAGLAMVTVLALVGACTPDGEPTNPSTSTSSTIVTSTADPSTAEPTTEPTPTEYPSPQRPAAMDEDSVDGAIAAVTYFLDLYGYVYATGDLEPWRAMSHADCRFCESVSERAEGLFADGGYVEGDVLTINHTSAAPPTAAEPSYMVAVDLLESSHVFYYGDGSTENFEERQYPNFVVAVQRVDDGWITRGVDTDSTL